MAIHTLQPGAAPANPAATLLAAYNDAWSLWDELGDDAAESRNTATAEEVTPLKALVDRI